MRNLLDSSDLAALAQVAILFAFATLFVCWGIGMAALCRFVWEVSG